MNYTPTTRLPLIACAMALALGPVHALAVSPADAPAGADRLSGAQIAEIKEMLSDHGIPPARQLASEITGEMVQCNSADAFAALYRPPALDPATAPPARAAVVRAPATGQPNHARAPVETSSPLRSLLRKILRFLRLSN